MLKTGYFVGKIQTSRVNNSIIIRGLGIWSFSKYRSVWTIRYIGRFSNALVFQKHEKDKGKKLDVQSKIFKFRSRKASSCE